MQAVTGAVRGAWLYRPVLPSGRLLASLGRVPVRWSTPPQGCDDAIEAMSRKGSTMAPSCASEKARTRALCVLVSTVMIFGPSHGEGKATMASYSRIYLGSVDTSMPPYRHCDLRGAEEADLSLCWLDCLPPNCPASTAWAVNATWQVTILTMTPHDH